MKRQRDRRTKKLRVRSHVHVTPVGEPWVFVFGQWCRANRVLACIEQQERLERFGKKKLEAPPEMPLDERRALARVFHGCKEERDRCRDALPGPERTVFDEWRRTDPTFREVLKAVITDRIVPPAMAARPLGPGVFG
jgi:hypothetical protein